MFRWFRRLFGIFGNKAEALLDSIENPRITLDQVIKDMQGNIQQARVALGTAEIQSKKSRIDHELFTKHADNFRASAETYLIEGDEERSRQMIKRAVEAEKIAQNFRVTTDKLLIDVDRLRESLRFKELKYQEARSNKHALLAQQHASRSLARLNGGFCSEESNNAFAEYERINEKISDQSVEAHTLFSMPSEYGGSGDFMMVDAAVEDEINKLKKRIALPQLEERKKTE